MKGAVGADLELTKLQQIKMYDCEGSGVGKAAMRGFAFFFRSAVINSRRIELQFVKVARGKKRGEQAWRACRERGLQEII